MLAENPHERECDHIAPLGWYSELVMTRALEMFTDFRCHLTPLHANGPDLLHLPQVCGAVVNVSGTHWMALRWDGALSHMWMLDSLKPSPLLLPRAAYERFIRTHANSYALLHRDFGHALHG